MMRGTRCTFVVVVMGLALACRREVRPSTNQAAAPVTSEMPSSSASSSAFAKPSLSIGERVVALDTDEPGSLVVHGQHVYFLAATRVARVPRGGGPVETLASISAYGLLALAVDDSGVYVAVDESVPATTPPPWKGSLWRSSHAGGDAKAIATFAEKPNRIVLDSTTVYLTSGEFNYDGPGGKLQGAGGVRAIDKVTGKVRNLAEDFCATSLTLDATAVYWASCEPSPGMITGGGLHRVAKVGGPKTRIPVAMEGAITFPVDVTLHAGRFYFRHPREMSSNDYLCSVPTTGGAADCSIPHPIGSTIAYVFDVDDLWLAVVPSSGGIDGPLLGKAPSPMIQVSSLVTADRIGRVVADAIAGLAIDDADIYWSTGHEIRARTKVSFVRGPE